MFEFRAVKLTGKIPLYVAMKLMMKLTLQKQVLIIMSSHLYSLKIKYLYC